MPSSSSSSSTSPSPAHAGPSAAPGSVRTAGGSSKTGSGASRLRPPRSLPPWIASYQENYGPASEDQLRLLNPPSRVVATQQNAARDLRRRVSKDGFVAWDDPQLGPAQDTRAILPHFLKYGRASRRGRKWDHLRSAEPVIVASYNPAAAQPSLAWHDFIHSSAWGHMPNEKSEVVDYGVLQKLQPTFDRSPQMPVGQLGQKSSQGLMTVAFYSRLWSTVMRHSLSPLLFRLGVMVTSLLALGIAASIYHHEDGFDRESAERTQSIVAVVVDCVAVPYIGYMIWDEYTGKPVGLRSGMSKIRLILLDLFFIIFKSASTALAFESLVYHKLEENGTVSLSTALGVFELVGLVSWSMNFAVNIFRTVERLGGRGDNDGRHV